MLLYHLIHPGGTMWRWEISSLNNCTNPEQEHHCPSPLLYIACLKALLVSGEKPFTFLRKARFRRKIVLFCCFEKFNFSAYVQLWATITLAAGLWRVWKPTPWPLKRTIEIFWYPRSLYFWCLEFHKKRCFWPFLSKNRLLSDFKHLHLISANCTHIQ